LIDAEHRELDDIEQRQQTRWIWLVVALGLAVIAGAAVTSYCWWRRAKSTDLA
jgi:hypothetical protein